LRRRIKFVISRIERTVPTLLWPNRRILGQFRFAGGSTKHGRAAGRPLFTPRNAKGDAINLDPFDGPFYRRMMASEIAMARRVFQDTIPYDRVRITLLAGRDDRPFTIPGNFVPTLALAPVTAAALNPLIFIVVPTLLIPELAVLGAAAFLLLFMRDLYLVNMGPLLFATDIASPPTSKYDQSVLIHELTHVWQGEHGIIQWGYVLDSVLAQGGCMLQGDFDGNAAYDIGTGKDGSLRDIDDGRLKTFSAYNAEQQARLVEFFFDRDSFPAFFPINHFLPYVRDNIRTSNPTAPTNLNMFSFGWARCGQCEALYFAGAGTQRPNRAGRCPGAARPPSWLGGRPPQSPGASISAAAALMHVPGDNALISVPSLLPGVPVDNNWQHCLHCEALYSTHIAGRCPGNPYSSTAPHVALDSSHFAVPLGASGFATSSWGRCSKCGVLFAMSRFGGVAHRLAGSATARNLARPFGSRPVSAASHAVCAAGETHTSDMPFTL
jgi:hypothetical protein